MKSASSRNLSRKVAALSCASALIISAVASAANPVAEEPAVWQAMVAFIASDNASRPFKQLYFQSDFETAPLVNNSMADPIRREYKDLCGLSASDAKAMVSQLQAVNAETVMFEQAIAEPAGMKIAKKKNPKSRYVALSRVVFDPTNQHAWLAVDLSGTTGSIMRLDKVAGQWSKTARCGGWMKSE
jgi:hypothetical protein